MLHCILSKALFARLHAGLLVLSYLTRNSGFTSFLKLLIQSSQLSHSSLLLCGYLPLCCFSRVMVISCWESLIFLFSICFSLLLSWVTCYWCAFVTFQTGCLLFPAQSPCRTPVVFSVPPPRICQLCIVPSVLSLPLSLPICSSVIMFTLLQLLQMPFLSSLPLSFGKLEAYVNWFCLYI